MDSGALVDAVTLDADTAAVSADHFLPQGQPQTDAGRLAGAGVVGAVEAFKQVRQVFGGDATTCIADRGV